MIETVVGKIVFLVSLVIWIALTFKLVQLMFIVSKRDMEYIEMRAKNELKPCPFCGGEAELVRGCQTEDGIGAKPFYIRCIKCGAEVGHTIPDWDEWANDRFNTCYARCAETAIEAWNTRV